MQLTARIGLHMQFTIRKLNCDGRRAVRNVTMASVGVWCVEDKLPSSHQTRILLCSHQLGIYCVFYSIVYQSCARWPKIVPMCLLYTTLHYTTLHCTTLHYTTLHYTTPHYTTHLYTALHYTTLHYTTLLYTTLHYMCICSNCNNLTFSQLFVHCLM
jgi:hypothetical protein